MGKGKNWIHVKLDEGEYDFLMLLCRKFGGLDETGMIKEMIRSYADEERGVHPLYEKRMKAEKQDYIDESLEILGRQFVFTQDPDDFDSFKEECERYGRVPEEVYLRTEVSVEVKEIMNRLGDLNKTEKEILKIMEPGMKYTKKFIHEAVHSRIKTSDSAINRARVSLGIKFERRPGYNGNLWCLPKNENVEKVDIGNMEWVYKEEEKKLLV